jgi:hypothetical protein
MLHVFSAKYSCKLHILHVFSAKYSCNLHILHVFSARYSCKLHILHVFSARYSCNLHILHVFSARYSCNLHILHVFSAKYSCKLFFSLYSFLSFLFSPPQKLNFPQFLAFFRQLPLNLAKSSIYFNPLRLCFRSVGIARTKNQREIEISYEKTNP